MTVSGDKNGEATRLVERLRHEASLRSHYGAPILEEAADMIESFARSATVPHVGTPGAGCPHDLQHHP